MDGDNNPIFNPNAKTPGEISLAIAIASKDWIIPIKKPKNPHTSPNRLKCLMRSTSFSDLSDLVKAIMIITIHVIKIKRFEYMNNGPPSLKMFANKKVIVFVFNDFASKVYVRLRPRILNRLSTEFSGQITSLKSGNGKIDKNR